MEEQFIPAKSDNLPKIDIFMMQEYLEKNVAFTAEMKGVKASRSERKSYGDNAIGWVQVKRADNICTVKAKITPEHNVRNKAYRVCAVCDEATETVISVKCEGCTARHGGCKHVIAFLAWLHRRTEEQSCTDIKPYWKKAKLAGVGSTQKFIKIKEFSKKSHFEPNNDGNNLLKDIVEHSKIFGTYDTQLTKYYKSVSPVEQLSIHQLINTMPDIDPENATSFIEYCKMSMNPDTCKEARTATKDQAECPLWHELRYGRITASKAYAAAHCKTLSGSLVEQIIGSKKIKDTDAMARGRRIEREVVKSVEKKIGEKIHRDGFILNAAYPVIGASPDGVSRHCCIEVKCPMSEKAMKNYITKDNHVTARYLAQVQIQMYMAKKEKALFCVAHPDFESSKNVKIVTVNYDKVYCESILNQCTTFWTQAIFPILRPRVPTSSHSD